MLALLEDYQRQNRLGINEMIKFPQAYAIEKDTVTINYDCLTIELRFCFDSEGIITSQRYPTGEIITCKKIILNLTPAPSHVCQKIRNIEDKKLQKNDSIVDPKVTPMTAMWQNVKKLPTCSYSDGSDPAYALEQRIRYRNSYEKLIEKHKQTGCEIDQHLISMTDDVALMAQEKIESIMKKIESGGMDPRLINPLRIPYITEFIETLYYIEKILMATAGRGMKGHCLNNITGCEGIFTKMEQLIIVNYMVQMDYKKSFKKKL